MRTKIKLSLIVILIVLSVLSGAAVTIKWKPMPFTNPGSKRMLKSDAGNYFYFRSLPEKNMLLDVQDVTTLEIRSMSKAKVNNPNFILHYNGRKTVYRLEFKALQTSGLTQYWIYEPIRITLPPNLTQLELTCYSRDIYFRAFKAVTIVPKPKIPPLKILASAGTYELTSETTKSRYYAFNDSTALSFQVNKGRPFALYVRAELTGRDTPVFAIYKDGKLSKQIKLSTRRSNSYKVEGILNLTIGRKVEFPAEDKLARYELRPVTPHLFMAKPVILKSGR
jgi:hypothetical protein